MATSLQKDELLRAVLEDDANRETDKLMHEFLSEKDLRSDATG